MRHVFCLHIGYYDEALPILNMLLGSNKYNMVS